MRSAANEPWLTLWVALALCAVAALFPNFAKGQFRRLRAAVAAIARHRVIAFSALILLVIGVRLAILTPLPVPRPGIHDEFSYLLMADTFAHGRLANPPHPMWRSFETFHVLWHPRYASKYPPAQGMVLALGQVLGHPWIGVLLSTAAMCAAIFWALCPFMPARWALVAALLAFLRLGVASYWMNSYWGGSVAAIGGALLLGGTGRILRNRQSTTNAVLLGLGLAILANSRPYEGLAFAIPLAIALLGWLSGGGKPVIALRARLRRVALPLAAMAIGTLLFVGYYNWRVTLDPFLLPHVLAGRQYDRSALFVWERARPPIEFQNAQLDDFYNGWERENYNRTWNDFKRINWEKAWRCSEVFFWPGLLLVLPGLLFLWRGRRFRLPLLALAATLLAFALLAWWNPHYIAPATCVFFGALAQGMRHLRLIRFRGRQIGSALLLSSMVLLVWDVAAAVNQRISDPLGWGGWGLSARAEIQEQLRRTPGQHLVMVRYGPDHSVHEEWVYNGADIDSQKVVWARELGAAQNAELVAYYKDRHVWVIEPDRDDSDIEPYAPDSHAGTRP